MTRAPRLHAFARSIPFLALSHALTLLSWGCSDEDAIDPCAGRLPGDLVISEIMANPSGADSGREWVEIYNPGSAGVSLAGIELVRSAVDGSGARAHRLDTADEVGAGDYYVLGGVLDAARPSYVDYGYGDALGDLNNTSGRVMLRCGERVLDEVVYLGTTDGASRAYDGSLPPNATANDDPTRWCDSTTTFSTGDFGSPGAPNPPCGTTSPTRCTEGGEERDLVHPTEGDLVITELHANPMAVSDGAGEWFEVLALAEVDLNGLELGKVPGTVLQTLSASECLRVSPGTYVLFAANADSLTNGGLPAVDFVADLALPNAGGGLFVGHNGVVLDAITYTSAGNGASTQLDPRHLSFEANDDPALFCRSTTVYGDGDRGTPGSANMQCMFPLPEGMCDADGTLREIIPPAVGDVVITEIMPDPSAVADSEGEWFEVYFASAADLNGLEMGTTLGSVGYRLQREACLRVEAGTYAVFARNAAGPNGGLPSDAIDYDTLTLGNSATLANPGTLFVGVGGEVLDVAHWFTSSAGVARSLDADALDPSLNESAENWCAAAITDTYGDGDRGTPGSANPACPFVLPAGQCFHAGVPRAIVPPAPGDLVITEVMADPSAVADTAGEWFEVWVSADVDLNGLQIGTTFPSVGTTLTREDCIPASAESFVLFARNADSSVNGGLPPGALEHRVSLANDPGALFIGVGGALLDQVAWTNSPTGASLQLEPGTYDASTNDALDTAGCTGTSPYGAGDLGTPGAENVACPFVLPPGHCLAGQTARAIVSPAVGEVVITEVMPNPDAVGDAVGEWFELFVTADVDLNGLQAGTTFGSPSLTLTRTECVHVSAGSHVLFARSVDSSTNGGLPGTPLLFGFTLSNGPGALYVGVDDTLLDQVAWTTSPTGASLQLEPSDYDAATNDAFNAVACSGTDPYGAGDRGTPGSENNDCLDPGECWDGENARAIVTPVVGDLYINEVMPNPATTEGTTEWFEVVTTANVDLNHVTITNGTAILPMATDACLAVPAGEYLVFARSVDPMTNGGLPSVDFVYGTMTLTNTNSMLSLLSPAETLDTVTWTTTMDGRSRSLIPGQPNPVIDNDDLANWCDEGVPYGDVANMNFGTPGEPNACL